MAHRSPERIEFLSDIIITAVEGGTGYWAQVSQYQYVSPIASDNGKICVVAGEQQGDETRATLHEMNDDETGYKDEGLDLTLDAVARGITKLLEMHPDWETLKQANRENDAGNLDSDDADSIVQMALLGEIVYG